MNDTEKYNQYMDEHPWETLFSIITRLILIAFSIWVAYITVISAMAEEWNKGIFFLILAIMAERALDRETKERNKKIE